MSGECKSNHNSYLLGDADLTNPMQACALIKEQFLSPSWIGIAKELYLSNNGGKFKKQKCFSLQTLLLFAN